MWPVRWLSGLSGIMLKRTMSSGCVLHVWRCMVPHRKVGMAFIVASLEAEMRRLRRHRYDFLQ